MKKISEKEWNKLVEERKVIWRNRKKPKLFCRHRWAEDNSLLRPVIHRDVIFPCGDRIIHHTIGLLKLSPSNWYLNIDKCAKCGGYRLYINSMYE